MPAWISTRESSAPSQGTHNKLALNAGWDEALLQLELADLREMGADLNLIGFDAGELAALFADKHGLTDPDETPAPEEHAVSRPGDAWVLGRHRLVCGDCTDGPQSKPRWPGPSRT